MVSIKGHYIVHYLGKKKRRFSMAIGGLSKEIRISSKKGCLIMEGLHGKDV
jgi:hypothetical protein